MAHDLPILPTYAERFQCIGSVCEDTCCLGWSVPIDQATYEKYQNLGPSPLRTSIDASVLLTPEDGKTASNVRPRFVACVEAFTAGIGNGPGATLDSLTAHYAAAHDRSYEPFFRRHPHILENYLINTILRGQFPYGREGMKPGAAPSMTREYALLTAQFALMKGLLIGVAGFHREQFSAEHVVHTVQAAAKHFEHHPEFLNEAHVLLVESRMDGARGLAILLRHASVRGVSDGPMPASVAIEVPEL